MGDDDDKFRGIGKSYLAIADDEGNVVEVNPVPEYSGISIQCKCGAKLEPADQFELDMFVATHAPHQYD